MIGYKATDKDGKCRGFQFEVGKTYTKDTKKEDLKCCTDRVFHFCRELFAIEKESDYKLSESRIFEVIAGDFVRSGDKYGTNSITILREIKGEEKKELINSGNRNSGDYNSGDYNSGNYNSGNRNSGNRNSGNWNSGNYNSGNYNSGFFNSNEAKIRMFNRETDLYRGEISIPDWCYFDLTIWVSHDTATEKEKKEHEQEIKTCGGFLRTLDYKDAWKLAYDKTDDNQKKELFELPNYDCKVFEEITGIDTRADFERVMENGA